jgi:hypothetical protein
MSTLFLNTEVPGGQQGIYSFPNSLFRSNFNNHSVYIAPNGLLTYTTPHSGYIPEGSITTGLTVNATTLQLNKYLTFWLCNLDDDEKAWRVWLGSEDEQGNIIIGGSTGKNGCTRSILRGSGEITPNGPSVWEYL